MRNLFVESCFVCYTMLLLICYDSKKSGNNSKITRFYRHWACICALYVSIKPPFFIFRAVNFCKRFSSVLSKAVTNGIHASVYKQLNTHMFDAFLNRLRFCYTQENLIEAIQQELEFNADCSVIIADVEESLVIYNSTASYVSEPEISQKIIEYFPKEWLNNQKETIYFLDTNLHITSRRTDARMLLLVCGNIRFLIVCPYIRSIEVSIFSRLFTEFKNYQERQKTLAQLLYYSELAQEWQMVANTQQTFLPQKIPVIDNLDIGVYFKPLVNVSGDYYDVIPITPEKTLIVAGDVSGKGLAAALVMGIVVNTIRVMKNKEQLKNIIYAVDSAIKRMHLQDKYTVIFLGLIDTAAMNIQYINASMDPPLILTKAPDKYKIKTLDSNCPIVGIIDMPPITVEVKPLYRGDLIVISSDGISETVNEDGQVLGGSETYRNALQSFAKGGAADIAQNIGDFTLNYSASKKFDDDITVLSVKLKG